MDDLITNEMVEAGCRGRTAVNQKHGVSLKWPDDFDEPYLQEVRASTRAALTAALPMIRAGVVEECAKECDFMAVETRKLLAKLPRPVQPTLERALVAQAEAAENRAAAIRALKGGEA